MLSRSFEQTASSDFAQQGRAPALTATDAAPDQLELSARTQRWLALLVVLLVTWATWSASAWLLADWQLR